MHETLSMLLPLAVILVGAKAAAQLSTRFGLPAVFGELVLGLVLGPSLLGFIHPNDMFQIMADIGVILLMFMAGLETDVAAMKSVGKASLLTAIGGVVLPLSGGYAVGVAFGLEWHHALFLGVVLTATSVSISAQTLRELGRLRSKEGSIILGAAVIDDVLGVLVFALVLGVSGEGNVFLTVGKMILFFPIAWIIGDKVVPILVRWERKMHQREASLALLLGMVLLYAWAAEALGSVATITGAYLLGIIVARHAKEGHIVHEGTAAVGYAFFIPVFFINIGLQAQVAGLIALPVLAGVLVALAIGSKVIGCGIGAIAGGMSKIQSFVIGCGMVSRGEVALVLAGAGLAAGLLDANLFSVLIVVTLATTLVTPPLLRLAYGAYPQRDAIEAAPVRVVEVGGD